MRKLSNVYSDNVAQLDRLLRVEENFDVIKKPLRIGADEVTLYYIDGFVKDTVMQKLMLALVSLDGLGEGTGGECARAFTRAHVAYVETDVTDSLDSMLAAVLSGASLMIGSRFGEWGIVIDSRSYPSRDTSEPENDRVMRGARDGFVETLIFNTALIRRRIRDTSLTMEYLSVGSASKTDVVLCYMDGRADAGYVDNLRRRLLDIDTDSLTLGHESLADCLIPSQRDARPSAPTRLRLNCLRAAFSSCSTIRPRQWCCRPLYSISFRRRTIITFRRLRRPSYASCGIRSACSRFFSCRCGICF